MYNTICAWYNVYTHVYSLFKINLEEFLMKRVHAILLALLCLGLMAMPAQARQAVGIHAKVVDGFLFLPDHSGSMFMKHKATGVEKIEMAKQVMARLNAKMPGLAYQGALCAVTPNKAVIAPGAWNRAAWAKSINALQNDGTIYGRLTPMAKGLEGLKPVLGQLPASSALVLISDGVENIGGDPVAALRALYAAYPGMTMHFVSVADNAKGLATLKALAAVKPGSLCVDARDLINTEEAALDFVRTAFYTETIPGQDVQSLREVFFQVGKYNITKAYAARLDALANVLKTRPELKIFLEGFADVTGKSAANLKLSDNRANAVKNYLVSKGCNGENIIIKGRGETNEYPTYLLNRRVEIMVIWQ